MNSSKMLSIDLNQEDSFSKFNPNQSFFNVYQTELSGQTLGHVLHSACEYKEHSYQQHAVVVHLRSEYNSLRRLGDSVEVENPSIGDIAIIPADVNHWQRIETEACEAIFLTIEPQIIAPIAHETINPDLVELLPTFAQPDPLIYGIASNLKANLNSDSYDKLYAESLFNALFLHLIRNYSTRQFKPKTFKEGLAPYKLKQVIELISDRLSEDVTIEQMSNYIELSPAHFARQFKKSTGLTPHQYVTKERLEKAKRLLKNKDIPLANIAADCGFTHQSHMGRLFKQATGLTPRKYRNEII